LVQTQLVQDATSVGPHAMGQLGNENPPATPSISRCARFLTVSRLRVSLRFIVFIVSLLVAQKLGH
jgi:hypothetical protein